MDGRRTAGLPVVTFALVSVLIASAGHALGHGHALDGATAVVAVALATGIGLALAGRWSTPRLLLALAGVQVVVHVLGSMDPDSRLVAATARAHLHDAMTMPDGAGSSTSMLLWHLVSVPAAALAIEAVRRSAVAVSWLARRWLLAVPVVLRAPSVAPAPDRRPRVRLVQPHLSVSRSNAPPCPA